MPEGETAARSDTDSGFQRQRKEFSARPDEVRGNIRMTRAQYEDGFRPFRKGLGGGTFDWLGYRAGWTAVCRFVAGQQGAPTSDPATGKLLVPVAIEILSSSEITP
jgi:hypothetical protein